MLWHNIIVCIYLSIHSIFHFGMMIKNYFSRVLYQKVIWICPRCNLWKVHYCYQRYLYFFCLVFLVDFMHIIAHFGSKNVLCQGWYGLNYAPNIVLLHLKIMLYVIINYHRLKPKVLYTIFILKICWIKTLVLIKLNVMFKKSQHK